MISLLDQVEVTLLNLNPNFSNKAVPVAMVHPLEATALSTPMMSTEDLGKN